MRGTTRVRYVDHSAPPISTHVPHAGHDMCSTCALANPKISTHVPHAGHDLVLIYRMLITTLISTHVPHAGHDAILHQPEDDETNFNSRAPCGARLHMLGLFSAKIQYLVILRAKTPENICIFTKNFVNPTRTSRSIQPIEGSHQKSSSPSESYPLLIPTCSILFFQ